MFNEGLKAKGKLKLTLFKEDGTVEETMIKNTVVDIGLNHIIGRLASDVVLADQGSTVNGLRYEIQSISDGTTVTVSGTQPAAAFITVDTNSVIDSADLPLLITGSGISADTYVTSLVSTDRINLNTAHSGVTDNDVLQIGETRFTDIGASSDSIGVAFTVTQPVVAATSIQLGQKYEILTVGTTDFTTIGAPNNTVGTRFVATGTGSGTGTAYQIAAGTGTVRPVTMSHMGVGSGSSAPSAADSALETEIVRVQLDTENLVPPSLIYNANFGPGVGTGVIREAAIFNGDSSDADMLCRTSFASINKGAADALEIQWIITITR